MHAIPTKYIVFEATVPASVVSEHLLKHVDTNSEQTTAKSERKYAGIIGDGGFRLKCLPKPSIVEGKIYDRGHSSELCAEVSLPTGYSILMIFTYLSLFFAVFLSFGLVTGALQFNKTITITNMIGAAMYYIPPLVSWVLFTYALNQAHRFNELLLEEMVRNLSGKNSNHGETL